MININIICIGKLKEEYWRLACAEYIKRLGAFCKIKVIELPECRLPDNPSKAQIENTILTEGKAIENKIGQGDYVAAMCIEGDMLSSEELAAKIEKTGVSGYGTVDFVIGGSYGLSDEIKRKANAGISMSRMTFPHQLARVLLLEQVYRAFMISSGGKYHK